MYHLRGAAFWHHSSPTTLPFVRLRLLSSFFFNFCCWWTFLLESNWVHKAVVFLVQHFKKRRGPPYHPNLGSTTLARAHSTLPGAWRVTGQTCQRECVKILLTFSQNYADWIEHETRSQAKIWIPTYQWWKHCWRRNLEGWTCSWLSRKSRKTLSFLKVMMSQNWFKGKFALWFGVKPMISWRFWLNSS